MSHYSVNVYLLMLPTVYSDCYYKKDAALKLAYKQFNHLKRSVFVVNTMISTHSQFNVLSGGLTECLVEPWHVGVSTAGSLLTRTLLSIPQWVIRVKGIGTASFIIVTSLAVVVTANKWRRNV